MNEIEPSSGRVREIREARQCSLQEARGVATREKLCAMVDGALSVHDLKPVLKYLIENMPDG